MYYISTFDYVDRFTDTWLLYTNAVRYTKTSRTTMGDPTMMVDLPLFSLTFFWYTLIGQEAKLTMFCTFQHGSQLVFELI